MVVELLEREVAIEAANLSRHYGGIRAVESVSLQVYKEEVLALVGDNGAGKSTLIKMLSGVVQPTGGEIRLGGRPVHLHNAAQARGFGIETVYQDLALCPDLSAIENMYLGREPRMFNLGLLSLLDHRRLRAGSREMLATLGAQVPLSIPVRKLSGGQRQAVAIARAAFWGNRLVIFDEPTAALGVAQSQRTLELVREVARKGPGVIVISHNLDEIFTVSDRIAVMRQGKLVITLPTAQASKHRVHRLMAGLGDEGQGPE
jgi:simple sugar transport system ATP-binding protein